MPLRFNIPEAEFRSRARQIKALAFDLDDTLLDGNKNIPPRALQAIRALQARGIFISICTARNCSAAQYYADLIGIRGVYSAVSGCQLVDGQTGEILKSRPMREQDTVDLVRFCLEHNAPFSLSAGHQGYVGGPIELDGEFMKLRSKRKKMIDPVHSMKRLTDPTVLYGKTVYKMVVHSESFYELLSQYTLKNIPDIQCVITSKGIVNMFPAGCNKGTGVVQIAEQMRIDPSSFCTFGDFLNDIPMFQAAGLSVAMGNAVETVCQAAAAVTEPADEDGIGHILEAVFLAE